MASEAEDTEVVIDSELEEQLILESLADIEVDEDASLVVSENDLVSQPADIEPEELKAPFSEQAEPLDTSERKEVTSEQKSKPEFASPEPKPFLIKCDRSSSI
mgnify:CR=1 FL=1